MGKNRHLGVRASSATRRLWARCRRLAKALDEANDGSSSLGSPCFASSDALLARALVNYEAVLNRRCREQGIDARQARGRSEEGRPPTPPGSTRGYSPAPVID